MRTADAASDYDATVKAFKGEERSPSGIPQILANKPKAVMP